MLTNRDLIEELQAKGIRNPIVLEAFARIKRELFVPESFRILAYEDAPLSIGSGQTISQPFIVARMTELLLGEKKLKKVLEIGTGSGFQAAILSQIIDEVYTIERIESLLRQAEDRFKSLGLENIYTRYADGSLGWPEAAPFDGIIVTAAAPSIPANLKNQLAPGGRLIIPIGPQYQTQELNLVTRVDNKFEIQRLDPVVFVPLVPGQA